MIQSYNLLRDEGINFTNPSSIVSSVAVSEPTDGGFPLDLVREIESYETTFDKDYYKEFKLRSPGRDEPRQTKRR